MGYTHFWHLNKKGNQKNYNSALKDIKAIIQSKKDILADGSGEKDSKPETKKCISFNGIEEESHETFFIPNKLAELEGDGFVFQFCKTARKEYDSVVVACITVLKHHLGDDVKVSSDGDPDELQAGCDLAKAILKKDMNHPLG